MQAARPGVADIHRAGVLVVAEGCVREVDAARERVAGVHGARDPVVAARARPTDARASLAEVPRGARVAVLAGLAARLEDAAHPGVAAIRGAGVLVRAPDRLPTDAQPLGADAVLGARVPIVAGLTLVHAHQGALAAFRKALAHPAGCVQGGVADHRGGRVVLAGVVRSVASLEVAEEPAIAGVLILGALLVLLALALVRPRDADPLRAAVPNGAGVPVPARQGVVQVQAAGLRRACVVRAGVVVIAWLGLTSAPARAHPARVPQGTAVPIVAVGQVG